MKISKKGREGGRRFIVLPSGITAEQFVRDIAARSKNFRCDIGEKPLAMNMLMHWPAGIALSRV